MAAKFTGRRRKYQTVQTAQQTGPGPQELAAELDRRRDLYRRFSVLCLLVFGIYMSILYFGHQTVPNSDWPGFIASGRAVLNFELPKQMKRVPGLGILHIALSHFMPGSYKMLKAAWLLNAILHPLNILLIYLIGRRFIGTMAAWIALIYAINPVVVQLLRQPMVEIPLLFGILLTFYLMFRPSRWCYLAAAATTMLRYEGAFLTFAAFVWDQLRLRGWQWPGRIKSFVCSAVASIPVGLWVLATYLTFKEGQSHYVKHYRANDTSLGDFTTYLWQVSVGSLFNPLENPTVSSLVFKPLPYLFYGLFFLAVGYALWKKRWEVAALLAFMVPYFLIHSMRINTHARYCLPIAWIVLLLFAYGMYLIWNLIEKRQKVPWAVKAALQTLVAIPALIWVFRLFGELLDPDLQTLSKRSVSLPYVFILAAVVLAVGQIWMTRGRAAVKALMIIFLMALFGMSNQFVLTQRIGNGNLDREFYKLGRWYVQHAEPGERMVTTMPHVVTIFYPEHEDDFIRTSTISGRTTEKFIKECYKRNIKYITWDSRIGLRPENSYYRGWRIDRIRMLAQPRDVDPFFDYVTTITETPLRYIHIFRLRDWEQVQKMQAPMRGQKEPGS